MFYQNIFRSNEIFSGPTPAKSGPGCSLENTEILGGDLPVTLGGGGVELEVEAPQQCYNR